MKKSLFTLLALVLFGTTAFAQAWPDDQNSYFQSQFYGPYYEFNASIIAVISIDGELQDNPNLELGVWNEVEGVICGGHTAGYFATYPDYPEYWVTFYGYPSGNSEGYAQSIMSFMLYDHETEQVLDYVCSYRLPFVTNDVDGTARQPIVLEFYSGGQDMVFVGQGDWNDLENWQDADRLPMALDNVTIAEGAICYMPEDAVGQYASLTIEDGAELYAPEGAEVYATVMKNIDAYEGLGGWYLLSFPTDIDNPDFNTAGMITNSAYDLFFFDQNFPGSPEEDAQNGEWRNYKYYMENGLEFIAPMNNNHSTNGYLYANRQNTTLHFTGNLYTAGSLLYQRPTYSTNNDQVGVNLFGNPYTCKAEVAISGRMNQDFIYMMNEERNDVLVYDISEYDYVYVEPMTSFFAIATASNNNAKVTLSPLDVEEHDGEEPGIIRSNVSTMSIELTANGTLKDRVYVKAGEGENCPKFNLNNNSTKLFIPQNNKNYAVAFTEGANVIPMCFTTNESGIYTLNFNTKNMNCSYLHLIDNVTGADIDLFQTPSYTFNSSDSNYATRFKLVFDEQATNEIADNFAFISNGELMINNSGNATLQVMDITGRILSTENIQNCYSKSLNLSAGVYVVRLSNGNDVKAQKIVVE